MLSKGIRGAITVDENTEQALKAATLELLTQMVDLNDIEESKRSAGFCNTAYYQTYITPLSHSIQPNEV